MDGTTNAGSICLEYHLEIIVNINDVRYQLLCLCPTTLSAGVDIVREVDVVNSLTSDDITQRQRHSDDDQLDTD